MVCVNCKFEESIETKFIGIFPAGSILRDTNGNQCGIFACPICNTVMYTNDIDYIQTRKNQYKNKMKNNI